MPRARNTGESEDILTGEESRGTRSRAACGHDMQFGDGFAIAAGHVKTDCGLARGSCILGLIRRAAEDVVKCRAGDVRQ